MMEEIKRYMQEMNTKPSKPEGQHEAWRQGWLKEISKIVNVLEKARIKDYKIPEYSTSLQNTPFVEFEVEEIKCKIQRSPDGNDFYDLWIGNRVVCRFGDFPPHKGMNADGLRQEIAKAVAKILTGEAPRWQGSSFNFGGTAY
ncbi:hypothetical protein NIES4106_62480 (plasmid) [Fischerella sp. NIES-4106]|nr:hypothetical protein NIES4106_62480 [Fischerella sp. NIES-4106]